MSNNGIISLRCVGRADDEPSGDHESVERDEELMKQKECAISYLGRNGKKKY